MAISWNLREFLVIEFGIKCNDGDSSSYLWDAVVDEDRGDGDVAADPVGDVRPVGPQRVGVILQPAALDTEPAEKSV